MEQQQEYIYKVLVVGDVNTGKTSIIKRYVHNMFSQHYKSTIGVDFALKVIQLDPNTIIRVQLWDIAGQERFGNLTRVYFKEAVGALVVFDTERIETTLYGGVPKWKADIDSKVLLPNNDPIPVVLVANKCDLQTDEFKEAKLKLDEFCEEHKFIGWYETSAKDGIGINDCVLALVRSILQKNPIAPTQLDDGDAIDIARTDSSSTTNTDDNKCC